MFVYVKWVKTILHEVFVLKFANKHSFEYRESANAKELVGRLFSYGSDEKMSNVIWTEYSGFPMRTFNYQVFVGSSKNRTIKFFTVTEIVIEKTEFPYILLYSKTMGYQFRIDRLLGSNEVKLPLEKQFSSKYDLYSVEGYGIEIYQIFSEDLMSYLVEHGSHLSIEFSQNKIYIYDDRRIVDEKELSDMITVSKMIIDQRGGLLKRLHDDFEVLDPYFKKNIE